MDNLNLPSGPKYDFVDFITRACQVDERVLAQLVTVPSFLASVLAFRAVGWVRLADAGFFCWADARATVPSLTEERLLDYIRIARYRFWLPAGDFRRIEVDTETLRRDFAEFFKIDSLLSVGLERSQYIEAQLRETGSFGRDHKFRECHSMAIKDTDESNYLDYWIARSEDEIRKIISNPRAVAGLDAMNQELLSFEGFLEKVYGADFDKKVLQPEGNGLLPSLPLKLKRVALFKIAQQFKTGVRSMPDGLRDQYPEMYQFYNPEAFGRTR